MHSLLLMILVVGCYQDPVILGEPGRYGEITPVARQLMIDIERAEKENRWEDVDTLVKANVNLHGKSGHHRFDAKLYQRVYLQNYINAPTVAFGAIQACRSAAAKGGYTQMVAFADHVIIVHRLRHLEPSIDDLNEVRRQVQKNLPLARAGQSTPTARLDEYLHGLTYYIATRCAYTGTPAALRPALKELYAELVSALEAQPYDTVGVVSALCLSSLIFAVQDESLSRRSFALLSKCEMTEENVLFFALAVAACCQMLPNEAREMIADGERVLLGMPIKDSSFNKMNFAIARSLLLLQEGSHQLAVSEFEMFLSSAHGKALDKATSTFANLLLGLLKGKVAPGAAFRIYKPDKVISVFDSFVSGKHEEAANDAFQLLDGINPADPFYATILDIGLESRMRAGSTPKSLLEDIRRCRSAYLDVWKRKFVPNRPIGVSQNLQSNPLSRYGITLAESGLIEEGLATIEVGRGWAALASIHRSKDKELMSNELVTLPDIAKTQTILKTLSMKTACLSFVAIDDRKPAVFVVTPTSITFDYLPGTIEEMRADCREWLAKLRRPGSSEEPQAAAKVYRRLIEPIAKSRNLSAYQRLVVVADGPLSSIPFVALVKPDGSRLIDRQRIVMLPSLRTLGASQPLTKADLKQVGFVIPEVPSSTTNELSPLRELGLSARASAKSLGGKVIEGTEITPGAIAAAAKNWKVTNFVTHGFLNPGRNLESFLLLGKEAGVDRKLTVGSVANLNLQSELACLWACDSSSGTSQGGDGNLSLAWAFLAAGCRSILASKWEVEQVVTGKLIEGFYSRLANEKRTYEEAFIRAVREVKSAHPDPYYWAAFEYCGLVQN